MMRMLEKSLPTFSAKDNHIRCMAHIVNVAVQELLSHLQVSPQEIVDHGSNIIGKEMKTIEFRDVSGLSR